MRLYYKDDWVTLYHGDAANYEGSVDAIITDPPYPMEFAEVWSSLAVLGVRCLPAGGLCLAYSGQYNLPDVMRRMEEGGMKYRWAIAAIHSSHAGIRPVAEMDVLAGWKPILVYRKPPIAGDRLSVNDVLQPSRESWAGRKRDHPWQQPVDEAALLVARYTDVGAVVLDPFAGSGSTLVAAKMMGRHGVGIEIDERHCESAARRLAQETLGLEAA